MSRRMYAISAGTMKHGLFFYGLFATEEEANLAVENGGFQNGQVVDIEAPYEAERVIPESHQGTKWLEKSLRDKSDEASKLARELEEKIKNIKHLETFNTNLNKRIESQYEQIQELKGERDVAVEDHNEMNKRGLWWKKEAQRLEERVAQANKDTDRAWEQSDNWRKRATSCEERLEQIADAIKG